MYLFSAVILLGILVFIHEAGHFVAAKLMGIRVEIFSLGFGKKIISKQWKDTEWRISLIPLGGYVKMTGESPEDAEKISKEEQQYSFSHKKWWQKLIVVFAGPLTNILFAIPIYMVVASYQLKTVAPIVETVQYKSPAEQVGIEPGDTVLSVNNKRVFIWDDIKKSIPKPHHKKCDNIPLSIKKDITGNVKSMKITPEYSTYKDILGDTKEYCKIGISAEVIPPIVFLLHPIKGIHSGDTVLAVDNHIVKRFYDIKKYLLQSAHSITVIHNAHHKKIVFTDEEKRRFLSSIYPYGMMIKSVEKESIAEKTGIKKGDVIVSVDDIPIYDPYEFMRYFTQGNKKQRVVSLIRNGKKQDITIPVRFEQKDNPYTGGKNKRVKWGASFYFKYVNPQLIHRPDPVTYIVYSGFSNTWEIMKDTLKGIWYMITGKLSAKGLGGPIMVFDISAKAAERGMKVFLYMMGVISINLGLINLFPIPVLDGGHILIFSIEGIRRKPLSQKVKEKMMTAGFIFLMMLMLFAVTNDIMRYISIFRG